MGFQPTALVLSASVCSWPLGFVIAVSGTLQHSCPIQTLTAPHFLDEEGGVQRQLWPLQAGRLWLSSLGPD